MTKSQFIKRDLVFFVFINLIFSAPYFGISCIVFNLNQCIAIWIITFFIEYHKMIDLEYLDYCLQFKEDINKQLTK